MSSHRNAMKRQKLAIKTITKSVQAKLDQDRKQMGEVEWKMRQDFKAFQASRPMGNY